MEEKELDHFSDFAIEGIATIVIAIPGLIGNTLIIVTLSKMQVRSSINLLFTSLAFFDLLFLVCMLLLLGIPSLSLKVASLREFDHHVVPKITTILEPIAFIAQFASTWTTVCVTVERYIAVCHPLKARYLCSYGKTRTIIIFTVIISVIVNIPEFIRTLKIVDVKQESNHTITGTVKLTLEENEVFSKVYDMWLYLLLMYVVPFLIFVALNLLIFRSIRIAKKERTSLTKRLKKEINLVAMLICVIVVYFLCNLSRIVYLLVNYYHRSPTMVDDVSTAFVILNSSVNFVIYYIFCEKFREVFQELFCRFRRQRLSRVTEDIDDAQESQRLNTLSAES